MNPKYKEKCDPVSKVPLADAASYAAMRINPADNAENLPPDYISFTLANLPERQKKRFLEGVFTEDNPDALWKQDDIDAARVTRAPALARIVIGVDPAVSDNPGSDSTGIVAAGLGNDGKYYVLADRSGKMPVMQWAKEVVSLYHLLSADRVVGEVNNGGDLIEAMLRQFDPDLSFRAVSASRGKIARAEPVAALYEKNLVRHAGKFPELEEQMTGYSPLSAAKSPDRLDALVWALTELTAQTSRFILA